jgi:hypothetical protein
MMMKYDGLIDGLVNCCNQNDTKMAYEDSLPVNLLHFVSVSFVPPAESRYQSP